MRIKLQAACLTIFALSTCTLFAQCGGLDGGTFGRPFQADYHCRDTQTLPNGSQIVQEHSGSEARDSQGRTYVEASMGPHSPSAVTVGDSAHGTMAVWQIPPKTEAGGTEQNPKIVPFHKTVRIIHYPAVVVRPESAADKRALLQSAKCPTQPREDLTCEDLGTRTIAGVVAYGTLEHRTVPAGQVGNDQPFVITDERWYSLELRLLVAATTNDPRDGEHTMVLENLEQSEPPASLFEMPEDYTVIEQPQ